MDAGDQNRHQHLTIITNTFRAQHPSPTSIYPLFISDQLIWTGSKHCPVKNKKKIKLMTCTQTWLNLIFEFSKLVLCSIWLRLRVINKLEMLPTKSEIQIVLNNTFLSLLEHGKPFPVLSIENNRMEHQFLMFYFVELNTTW